MTKGDLQEVDDDGRKVLATEAERRKKEKLSEKLQREWNCI